MSSDFMDCRTPRAHACTNLVPIPRALKKLYGATLSVILTLRPRATYLYRKNG